MNEDAAPSRDLFYEGLIASYVNSPRFVRRDWLSRRMEMALATSGRPIVLLTAEPGAGKTAFMAWLARQHPDWPRYFIRRDQHTALEDGGARGLLEKIGFQLAVRYPEAFQTDAVRISVSQTIGQVGSSGQVTGGDVDRLVASPFYTKAIQIIQEVKVNQGSVTGLHVRELVTDPNQISLLDLQRMALLAPALALQKQGHREPIVVLIDALDELRYRVLGDTVLDWLTQCPELPANVRILVTSRPDREWLAAFRSAQRDCLVEETIPQVGDNIREDLTTYAGKLAAIPKVESFLVAHMRPGQSADEAKEQFVAAAAEKASGNLGYVDAVGRAIDQAIASNDQTQLEALLDLRQLPATLQDLYGHFLRLLRQSVGERDVIVQDPANYEQHFIRAWINVYRPVLGVLAVAMEPVTPAQIHRLGRMLVGQDDVSEAIGRLRQFLDEQGGRYTFYHATLPEFLVAETTRQNPEYQQLAVDPAIWHAQIVKSYRGQAAAWDQVDWRAADDYGLSHLARHLYALRHEAGYCAQLYSLICRPLMFAKRERTLSDLAFAEDLDIAIKVAAVEQSPNWCQLVRCCLLHATLGLQASRVPPAALSAMVWLGQVDRAICHAELAQDAIGKSRAYVFIADALIANGEPERASLILQQALGAAESASQKAKDLILRQVAVSYAKMGSISQTLILLKRITAAEQRTNALVETASAFGQVKSPDGLYAICGVLEETRGRSPVEVMCAIALAYANIGERLHAVAMAEQASGLIDPKTESFLQVRNIALVLAELGQVQKVAKLVRQSGELAASKYPHAHIHEYWHLADALGMTGNQDILTNLHVWITTTLKGYDRDSGLAYVAYGFARAGSADRALIIAEKIASTDVRVGALTEIGSVLLAGGARDRAEQVYRQALALADAIEERWSRAKKLSQIAFAMADLGRIDLAEEITQRITDLPTQLWTSSELAQKLAEGGDAHKAQRLINQIVRSASSVGHELFKTSTLIGVARGLAKLRQWEQALVALETIQDQLEPETLQRVLTEDVVWTRDSNEAIVLLATGEKIQDPRFRAIALLSIALNIIETDRRDQVERTLEMALQAMSQAGNISSAYQTTILTASARVLMRLGLHGRAAELAELARHTAQVATDARARAESLTAVAELLAELGEVEQAATVAEDALKIVLAIDEDRYGNQSKTLTRLAILLAQLGSVEGTMDALRAVTREKPAAIAAVAEIFAGAGDRVGLRMALEIAGAIRGPQITVSGLPKGGSFTREDESDKAEALADVARIMARAGDLDGLHRTVALTGTISAEDERAGTLNALAPVMARARDLDGLHRALVLAGTISAEDERARALSTLAQAVATAGDLSALCQIRAAAARIQDANYRAWALGGVAVALAEAAELNEALSVVDLIQDSGNKTTTLVEIAQALAEKGERGPLLKFLDRRQVVDCLYRTANTPKGVAVTLVKMGEVERAIAIGAPDPRSVTELAQALLEVGRRDRAVEVIKQATSAALEIARRYPSPDQKTNELLNLALEFIGAGVPSRLRKATSQSLRLAQNNLSVRGGNGDATGLGQAVTMMEMQNLGIEVAQQAMADALVAAPELREGPRIARLIGFAKALTDPNLESKVRFTHLLAAAGEVRNPQDRPHVLISCAEVFMELGHEYEGRNAVVDAFVSARLVGRECVFGVLEEAVPCLAGIAGDDGLSHIYDAIREAEDWWSA